MKSLIKALYLKFLRAKLGGTRYARRLGVKVGEGCRIYISSFGSEPWLIEIGDRVTITSGVRIITHDGSTWLMRDEKGRRFLYRKVEIGNDVFIGLNSIILPGVRVGNNCIIAAGSVVIKSIPDGSIVGGNPARIIGSYDEYKNKVMNEYVSEEDIDSSLSYQDRILKVLDKNMKPNLEGK
ncbi:MAG: acyltransferase [Saprospiraceae bacterium]|nr:acyltransferase [Saprospiraceae bacterium]